MFGSALRSNAYLAAATHHLLAIDFMRYRTLCQLASFSALYAGLASPFTAQAAEARANRFTVSDSVISVQLCGNRNQGSKKATQPYRLVQGEQNGQSYLYVQWMNQPEDTPQWRGVAAHTQGFAEINDDNAGLSLSNLRCTAKGKAIQISANVTGGKPAAKRRQLQLEVGPALEKYSIVFTPALK
ncbi:hypothetical protein GCM10027276_21410 [Comamonas piscis]